MASFGLSALDLASGIEHLRIEFTEKFRVQPCHYIFQIRRRYHNAQVQGGSALRDHHDIDVAERRENASDNAALPVNPFTDKAHDGSILSYAHLGKLAQIPNNSLKMLGGIDGQRDADLRRRNHIHRGLVACKDIEHALEKSVSHKHPQRLDIQHRRVVLRGNRLNDIARWYRVGDHQRAFHLWPPRIQNPYWNIALHRRGNGRWVQDLGTKVG